MKHGFKSHIRKVTLYSLTILLVSSYPLSSFAETAPDASVPPVTTTTGQTTPPDTHPVYDPTTQHWNNDNWRYNSTTGTYQPVQVVVPAPVPTIDPPKTDTSVPQPADPTTVVTPSNQTPITGNTIATDVANAANTNANNTTGIGNGIGATAQSGNTTVANNTTAGNATSGDATNVITAANIINSSVAGAVNAGVANFVSNISGDVNGDILLDPMILGALLKQSTSAPSTLRPTDATINLGANTQINNDINLNSTTGTANVTGNTSAGNATTGNANTVANVMNIINSIIAANKSFIGTINIYGNLNGDILVAPDFIPKLIASNNAPTTNQLPSSSLDINLANTQSITNNLNLTAATGAATVTGNTTAGNATTGNALTNVVILNLSGHQVVASNSLLVFVNVLGKWIGLIVDAPVGSTAAALGNGVNQDTVINGILSAQTNAQITNNINLNATSGNATVADNTKAGNATTGNATASANLLNMTQSTFGLSGWFGVLFINVFGTWLGSFGINTPNGDPILTGGSGGTSDTTTSQVPLVFRFIPKANNAPAPSSEQSSTPLTLSVGGVDNQPPQLQAQIPEVLGAQDSSPMSTKAAPNFAGFIAVTSIIGALILYAGIRTRGIWPALFQRIRMLLPISQG